MNISSRTERECQWCAQQTPANALICEHCSGELSGAARAYLPVLKSPIAAPRAKTLRRPGLPKPLIDSVKVTVGLAVLLSILYLIKHYFEFSLTNCTLFLFMPIGPVLIGLALGFLIILGPKPELLNYRWLACFVALGIGVFFADQYFAYLHDGAERGFGNWYPHLVEHRSWVVSFRGRSTQKIDRVGDFGYVLEAVKVIGILFLGLVFFRDDRKRARAMGK
jgi:hypothetical protein